MKRDEKHYIGSLLPIIRSSYNSLTKSEQKVADYVLLNTNNVIYSSIDELAEMANVGDTTVLRFCRKVGYKGFQSFKMALAQDLTVQMANYEDKLSDEIQYGDTINEVSQKTLNYMIQGLNETKVLLAEKSLEEAIEYIINARRVEFFGVGTSSLTALDAVYRFIRIGINAGCYIDTHIQNMNASLLTADDLAIGISFSGSTKDTVEALSLAKKSGAKTICITHYAKSPITKYSDIVLISGSKENPLQGGAISSKVSQLMVIDIIYNNVFLRIYEKALKNKEKTSAAVLNKLY